MANTSTFKEDLARGQKVEREVLKLVKEHHADAYIVDGYCKEWDIYIPSINKGVEVKYDPMSQRTGNIVVEIEYNSKPSALQTTKAYRWVFHTGKQAIITTPSRIKVVIESNNLKPVKFTGLGDPHPKLAYLIKKHLLVDSSIVTKENIYER